MVHTQLIIILGCLTALTVAQGTRPTEADYYPLHRIETPKEIVLEVGGIALHGKKAILVSTRRGEVWHIHKCYQKNPQFRLFADGLQEPLGLLEENGAYLVVQRGELSRMRDIDGDNRADVIECLSSAWPISGNYHEYAFGPRKDAEGNLWVTLNKPFGDTPFGEVPWRGWGIRLDRNGGFDGMAAGLRSPAGIESSPDGEMFFTDNQGEWCGAGKLSVMEEGSFHGHPHGIESCKLKESRVKPIGEVPKKTLMPELHKQIPSFTMPAVFFPYDKMGKSPSGFAWDTTKGGFGPFQSQVFVGDQHHASVMRVFLERVKGKWQGACFPFRSGLDCGVTRVLFGADNSLIAGMSNRGWGSKGNRSHGLQRLVWSGLLPFEILEMRALPDGFQLVLTKPVDVVSAAIPFGYQMESYTYEHHKAYGSKEMDKKKLMIRSIAVHADGLRIDLTVDGLRPGYVHELHAKGLRDKETGHPLLHTAAYYTLLSLP